MGLFSQEPFCIACCVLQMVTLAPFRAVRPASPEDRGLFDHAQEVLTKTDHLQQTYHQYKLERRFIQDAHESMYIYRQRKTDRDRTYTGIITGVSIDDYMNGVIKIHEKTLPTREAAFREQLNACNFSTEPVLIAYPEEEGIQQVLERYTSLPPDFDFDTQSDTHNTGTTQTHQLWAISEQNDLTILQDAFHRCSDFYLADGHHRSASSVGVGMDRRHQQGGQGTGKESFNFFMCLFVSFSELEIFSFNRIIKNVADFKVDKFLQGLSRQFLLTPLPCQAHVTCHLSASPTGIEMYVNGAWWQLQPHESNYPSTDPVHSLDSWILSHRILQPLLGIYSHQAEHIEYVSGMEDRSLLQQRVDNGEAILAFALPSVTLQQLQVIADNGRIMPPKSTWIEPKLQRGLTIFEIF